MAVIVNKLGLLWRVRYKEGEKHTYNTDIWAKIYERDARREGMEAKGRSGRGGRWPARRGGRGTPQFVEPGTFYKKDVGYSLPNCGFRFISWKRLP